MAHQNWDALTKERSTGFKSKNFINTIGFDIWLILVLVPVTLISIYIPPVNQTFLRFMLGLAMILLLPGYALLTAIFPGKRDLGGIERAILSVVLSILVVPMFGFILNYTQQGIGLDDMAFSITAFVIVCSFIGAGRRFNVSPDETTPQEPKKQDGLFHSLYSGSPTNKILSILVAIYVLLLVITVTYFYIIPVPGEKFTEFYIVGPDGNATNYPTDFKPGEEKPVNINIINHEYRNVTYDLVITLSDEANVSTLFSGPIALDHNQTWKKTIGLKPDLPGSNMKMEFKLFKDMDMTSPYRDLYLWVNVTNPTAPPTSLPYTAHTGLET